MPLVGPLAIAETALALGRVEIRRRLVDREAPWRSRGPAGSIRRPSESGRTGCARGPPRATFEIARTVFGAEPSELSLLYFLWSAQAAGSYRALTEFEGGAQDSRFVGGAEQVCDRLAAELGDAVISEPHAVDRATQLGGGASTPIDSRSRPGESSPPPLLSPHGSTSPRPSRHRVSPQPARRHGRLHEGRSALRARVVAGQGSVRARVRRSMPGAEVVDDIPPGGQPGVLVGSSRGARSRPRPPKTRSAPARGARSARAGGGAGGRKPRCPPRLNWFEEPWSRGAPVGVMGRGRSPPSGRLCWSPVECVHWAGTETAPQWPGYMDGGVQAGERAAREVAQALGRSR